MTIGPATRLPRLLRRPLVSRCVTRAVRPLAPFLGQDALMHLPVAGVVEVCPPGTDGPAILMGNDGNDRIAAMLFWRRGVDGREPTTIRTFLRLVSPGSTVLDVGANSGLFSLLAARRHPTVTVHAIEPVARVFSVLESNVALNGLSNVTCHRMACSDRSGTATLHVPAGEAVPVMASLLAGWPDTPAREEQVACTTIDELGVEADVVKIDAEGSEDAVLRGARATLAEQRPFVLAEVLGRPGLAGSVTAALAEHDYRFFRLGPRGVTPCDEIAGGTDDDENHNYLFAHASRLSELRL
ncbi:MAG TPA: FkbM family methyltransferase [Acidimicrobiales bacterium]|nr:FkbM family methyltransferase [Acidimicrobiales bacterium]HWI05574.1 FkbM family methyltransferase [Acidimicrobiales bacterium]